MQEQNLSIFTEQNKDDESFLQAIQNSGNAVVFIVLNGEGQIVQEVETTTLLKNSIVFFEPNYVESIKNISADFKMKVLVYRKEYLAEVNIKLNKLKIFKYFSQYFRDFSNFTDQEISLLSKQLDSLKYLQDSEQDIGFEAKIFEHLFSAFIYSIIGIYLQKEFFEQHEMSRADEITFLFTKNVFKNCVQEKSPKYYADLQNITSRHLNTMVKTVTGKTASDIIAEFVMNEAKILLESTDKTITQIADELNFGDSYTFSHYFKRNEGRSPVVYRTKNS